MPDFQGDGTIIQVYGRFFAGTVDMNMEPWFKVNTDFAGEPFKIQGVSPLSIAGEADPTLQKYREGRTNLRVRADVRKNFDDICAKSHCDWFVLDNSAALMWLTEINGRFYSLMGGEKTDFMDDYFNNNAEARANGIDPIKEGFSERLRRQYDLFIDILLKHYTAERIILVRSNVPRFGLLEGKVVKTKHTAAARKFLQELDEYFVERVGCVALNTSMRFFERTANYTNHPFQATQWDLHLALEQDIMAHIEFPAPEVDKLEQGAERIADYIADGGRDIGKIEEYFRNTTYTFEDIAAIYWLQEQAEDKSDYANIAREILANKRGLPYKYTRGIFNNNIGRLREYPFCLFNLDEISYEGDIVVRLDNHNYIMVASDGLHLMNIAPEEKWDYKRFIENKYVCGIGEIEDVLESFEAYFERGRRGSKEPFILRFMSYDDFIMSLCFMDYEDILNNENIVISFVDDIATEEFAAEMKKLQYEPKVDLAFFFDERSRICQFSGAGTADQMRFFRLYCEIDATEPEIEMYYNDLYFDSAFSFTGMQDVVRMTRKCIEEKRLSKILSRKLRLRKRRMVQLGDHGSFFDDSWRRLGLEDAYGVVSYERNIFETESFAKRMKMSDRVLPMMVCPTRDLFKEYIINHKIPNKTALCHAWGWWVRAADQAEYERHFAFPSIPKEDVRNYELAQLCAERDAVAVHIRRCDYLTHSTYGQKWRFNIDYKKAIEMVYTQEPYLKYENKHLLVFSDDMEWVKENAEGLGLHLAGDNITYCDWNYHLQSYRDMHLISLCKIVIMGQGNFALTAGLMSEITDYIIAVTDAKVWVHWQRKK